MTAETAVGPSIASGNQLCTPSTTSLTESMSKSTASDGEARALHPTRAVAERVFLGIAPDHVLHDSYHTAVGSRYHGIPSHKRVYRSTTLHRGAVVQ